jgi:hypothetical protein
MRHNSAATLRAKMRALIHALNTTDLVIQWNLSTVKMEEAKTDDEILAVAQVRDFLLEAFEYRDPKAYRAWFEDDDSTDDPSRFYKSNEPSKFKALTV